MDIVNSVLMLIYIVSLLGTVLCNKSVVSKIDGFQKQCEDPGCRYTGKIVGSVTFNGPDDSRFRNCVYIFIQSSIDSGSNWKTMCATSRFLCQPCANLNSACRCSGQNPLLIEFYPNQDAMYQVTIIGTNNWDGKWPAAFPIVSTSNIFDSTTKPDNWNPISVQFSSNGNNQLTKGTNIVGITTLFAFLLRNIMFDD
ncbi:uncharacterized protein LOC131951324 [Physella acuta]|uniref:uncharacterized protein LOC131951324 n=1 Tax=Physella acuta TaxID=109671 RepID=UPI0027DD319A|nr:uncharacterized protein LOC131951324 [Physella acuta]XP_059169662.1 uncharacterized protein LOC131951324 [Physella acuta]